MIEAVYRKSVKHCAGMRQKRPSRKIINSWFERVITVSFTTFSKHMEE